MLSVGRELNINNKRIVCKTCCWQGVGAELAAGLFQVTSAPIYLYVYRCPDCASFELARKGTLLQFRPRVAVAQEVEEEPTVRKSEHAISQVP